MDEKYVGTRTCCEAADSNGACLFGFGAVPRQRMSRIPAICRNMGRKNGWFSDSTHCREMDNMNDKPIVFEWKIFPSAHHAATAP